jgi:hypothetical protein
MKRKIDYKKVKEFADQKRKNIIHFMITGEVLGGVRGRGL